MVPLTAVAGGAAVWALAQPNDRAGEDTADAAGDGARLAATLAENGALRERLNVSRDAQTDVQRQLAELRTQLQRLEAEANPLRRKCDRLKEQIEMERSRHVESTHELSAEAARLRDYSNELIFTMIMNGVSPDAMSVSLESPSATDGNADGSGPLDPTVLAEQNQQLSAELSRLRGALVRAVCASRDVSEERDRRANNGDGSSWHSPDGIGELAERRRRYAKNPLWHRPCACTMLGMSSPRSHPRCVVCCVFYLQGGAG